MQLGSDDEQRGLLMVLFAAGVPDAELIRLEPQVAALQPELAAGLLQRVPRLMLVQPGRSRPMSDGDIARFSDLLAATRARRQAHKARLTEYMSALRPAWVFRDHLALLRQVVSFLAARPPAQTSKTSGRRYFCTVHGCRVMDSDVLGFLRHVQESHL